MLQMAVQAHLRSMWVCMYVCECVCVYMLKEVCPNYLPTTYCERSTVCVVCVCVYVYIYTYMYIHAQSFLNVAGLAESIFVQACVYVSCICMLHMYACIYVFMYPQCAPTVHVLNAIYSTYAPHAWYS
jgi:hypothetical protein